MGRTAFLPVDRRFIPALDLVGPKSLTQRAGCLCPQSWPPLLFYSDVEDD